MRNTSQQLVQDRIEELRENTDFVSTLFESLTGYAIIAADFDGNVIAFNEGACQIYGYAPEEVIGRQSIEIFFPEEFIEAGKLQEIIDDLIEKERYSYEGEKVRKNGEVFPAQILFTLTKDRNGKVVGFIEIVADLTERKRAEEELRKHRDHLEELVEERTTELKDRNEQLQKEITERKRAQQAQERLSQQLQEKVSELETFSFGIAHDLRSPMLSIEGFSRELRADIQNQKMERVQEDIRLLESGIRKMQQFLNRTLEYSRAGYQVKLTKNVPFGKIVQEVITEFAEQVRSIGATVSLAETFPKVYADRIRIRQVLTNLIQNSINYRDKTMPLKIDIGYWLSGDEVVFFVRDNGLGIDASEAEKVFALFYRGTTDGEGSGAGLAIVKRIIEAHGGRIWVQQGQSGKGTTMCFTLPQQSDTNKGDNNGKD